MSKVRLDRRWFAGLVFVLTIGLYLATLPRGVLPGDSGELIAASRTLSIAHPPGYPIYMMVGKLFSSLVMLGPMAFRYNLLSAVAVSVALALLYLILTELGVGRLVGLAVALGLGTLESFWLQATMAEVYALNGLFTVLLLYCSLLGRRYGQRSWLLLGYVGGLALSHHLSLVYPLICAAGILMLGLRVVPRARTIVLAMFLGIVGLSTWLYIPVRASLGPPLVWGRTETVSGFLSHITAQGYRWRLREFAVVARARDFLDFFRVSAGQTGFVLLPAALFGLIAGIRRSPVIAGFVLLVLFFAGHFAMYNIPDIESHIFPAMIGIGILAGVGFQRLVTLATGFSRSAGTIVTVGPFLILAINLFAIQPRQDQWFGNDYADAIQESAREACGDDCIVITSGDLSTFPLLYASLVEPNGVLMYDLAASNPSIIGAGERPSGLEECASMAAEMYGKPNVALLGPLPRFVLGAEPYICGMVSVIERPATECSAPADYEIRGVAMDLREYSSRLLSGSYYLHLARWYAQQGDTAAVRYQVDLALDAAHDDVGTHINAAAFYLSLGMGREAFETASAAVAVDPDFFEAHDLMANMLAGGGRFDEAISEYKKALKGNPSPALVHSNLGYAYAGKGDRERALEHFHRAIELDSTLANAYIGIGRALESAGQIDEALSYLERARSIDPSSIPAYHAEATVLLRMDRPAEAREIARRGLDARPGNPLLVSDVGLCYLRMDNLDSAVVYLEEALRVDPSLLTARGNLAVAFERKGQTARAVEEYRKYLEAAPSGGLRDRARQALERLLGDRATTD
jgi:tetratricopeptide (TPR) repeat protein